jgi:ABC transporter DrrB family efflux protein
MSGLNVAISDTLVLAERSVKRIQRQPDLLTAFTIQPIMFVLLFVYVFGGAIEVPAQYGDYTDFLMPGIIVQAICFGGFVTALGLAEDMQRGLIDRFRSLPMSPLAVLTGRTLADIGTNALQLVVMIIVGLIVGFAFTSPPLEVVAGIALMLLIGYAFSWVFAFIGLTVSSPESANAFGFMIVFPLTFLSSAFVPPDTFPAALETFAEDINPFSTMVDAARALFIDTPAGNDIWASVAWCVALIAVFGYLSVRKYKQAVAS